MRIILNTMNREQREISISFEESKQISQALKAGVEFITIGTETINAKYVIGIVDDNGIIENFKKLPEPKTDQSHIGNILAEMREHLKANGIIK